MPRPPYQTAAAHDATARAAWRESRAVLVASLERQIARAEHDLREIQLRAAARMGRPSDTLDAALLEGRARRDRTTLSELRAALARGA